MGLIPWSRPEFPFPSSSSKPKLHLPIYEQGNRLQTIDKGAMKNGNPRENSSSEPKKNSLGGSRGKGRSLVSSAALLTGSPAEIKRIPWDTGITGPPAPLLGKG